ncbi:MAG: YraN family protein [Burkholderiaceae bacterium]
MPRPVPPQPGDTRSPRQRAGDATEDQAARHLQAQGLALLDRQVRYREGELDLVCRDGDVLVFVEVRLRRHAGFGGGAASVDFFKRQRLIRAAQHYLISHWGSRLPACRFDVVSVDASGTIEWIRDAFALD